MRQSTLPARPKNHTRPRLSFSRNSVAPCGSPDYLQAQGCAEEAATSPNRFWARPLPRYQSTCTCAAVGIRPGGACEDCLVQGI